jgi:hypothetical protein
MRAGLTGDITENRKNDKNRNLEKALAMKLLPTPKKQNANSEGLHGQGGMDLQTQISLLPTPTSHDNRDRGSIDDPCIRRRVELGKNIDLSMTVNSKENGLKLQTKFVEWMLHLPPDYTNPDIANSDLKVWETVFNGK